MCNECNWEYWADLAERATSGLPRWKTRRIDFLHDIAQTVTGAGHVTARQAEVIGDAAAEVGEDVDDTQRPGPCPEQRLSLHGGWPDEAHDACPWVLVAAPYAARGAASATLTRQVAALVGAGRHVVELTAAAESRIVTLAGAGGSNEAWNRIRTWMATAFEALVVAPTDIGAAESPPLGRGTASFAQAFLDAGRPVYAPWRGAFSRVYGLRPSSAHDWKRDFARAVLTPQDAPASQPANVPVQETCAGDHDGHDDAGDADWDLPW